MSATVDCLELVEVVTDYLEGVLTADHAANIEGHLVECEECAAALAQFRFTIAAAGHLAADDVAGLDPNLRTELLDIFRDTPG